jgi:hypothetical protein
MERLACLLVAVATTVACQGREQLPAPGSTAAQSAAEAAAVGTSCAPVSPESSPSFGGFDAQEVNIATQDPRCGAGVCLVNHFQGLTTCPYGQTADGGPPASGVAACTVPGSSEPVRPAYGGIDQTVRPQCLDRRAADTVYCSCRCANASGATDDGYPYCACPSGFTCTQLLSSIGSTHDDLSGAYCIKGGTKWDPNSACGATCEASARNCP